VNGSSYFFKPFLNLFFKGIGYADSSNIKVTGLPSIQSISQSQGSVYGGLALVLNGNGFTLKTNVLIGSSICKVTQATLGQLTCLTSASSAGVKNFNIGHVFIFNSEKKLLQVLIFLINYKYILA
jgi:hypothetical protein